MESSRDLGEELVMRMEWLESQYRDVGCSQDSRGCGVYEEMEIGRTCSGVGSLGHKREKASTIFSFTVCCTLCAFATSYLLSVFYSLLRWDKYL